MSAIEVGIRVDMQDGVAFFGLEEVNQRIVAGGRVIAVNPAGAIVHRVGEDGDIVRVVLGGCQLEIVFEEA